MTNVIVLSSILVTNWNGIINIGTNGWVERGSVSRMVELGYRDGTNLV